MVRNSMGPGEPRSMTVTKKELSYTIPWMSRLTCLLVMSCKGGRIRSHILSLKLTWKSAGPSQEDLS